ncbi:MAG: glycosyltransferase family 2 protein [Desulfobacterota bacterium]|nr:glycosyltransferase family 2 protein [Thermodesulfobacteriota bacterium]
MKHDLAVVMPVYNEEACIATVVRDWIMQLSSMEMSFTIIVLNDGSKDNTQEVLAACATDPRVQVINKPNSGHGPTILQGYRMAVKQAQWVFQVDSDNEIAAANFPMLWEEHNSYDMLIGVRDGRQQPLPRKVISMISRLIVRLFYGTGVTDVNCPFRLMRASVLEKMLMYIPDNTFAPNVAISGMFALSRRPVANVPVPHAGRTTGEVSIKKWKLFKAALKSCIQTLRIRLRLKKRELTL